MNKRLVILLMAFTVILLTIPPGMAATSPSLSGVQLFPKDAVWNVPIDTLPVDAKSSLYVNSNPTSRLYVWDGFPYNVADASTPRQYLKSIATPIYSDNILYPIPANAVIQSQSDRHLLVVDKSTNHLNELYQASKNSDGTYSAGVAVAYDLSSYALRPDHSVSADAAGLPILQGIVRYEEVASGSVNHALRFAVNNLRNTYIWPARAAAGSSNSDSSLPPHGQRFRLKASFDTSGFGPQEKIILEALKKYGMILADWNGGDSSNFHICADPDSRWSINYAALQNIRLTDFEAVDESSIMINKDSSQATIPRTSVTTKTKIGVFRPSTQLFYLDANGNGAWNGALIDKAYSFGLTGDIPINGDWNGDGRTEIGVFRPSTQLFYLDANGNGAWNGALIDKAYSFGLTGDIPITGDWNGDGRTEIGVFRPSTQLFYLDANGNGAWNGALIDKAYSFGLTGDIPITGDWNGDGRTDIGIFRPSTHMFYLDANGNGAWNGALIDKAYNFGLTGDIPITGDWNGDGRTDIGVFRPSTDTFHQDYSGDGVWDGAVIDRTYNFGLTGDLPISGKWA
jgi:hypothetical protein